MKNFPTIVCDQYDICLLYTSIIIVIIIYEIYYIVGSGQIRISQISPHNIVAAMFKGEET